MKLRILRRIFVVFFISLAGVLVLLFAFLNLPFSQRFATRQVNLVLAGAHVPVHIDAIGRILPNSLVIRGILISGVQGDTIIYAGELNTDCRPLALMRSKVILQDLDLKHAIVNLVMNDSTRKYNIAEAFQSVQKPDGSKPEEGKASWLISIKRGDLSVIKFRMIDSAGGILIDQNLAGIGIRNFNIDLAAMELRARTLEVDRANGSVFIGTPGQSPGPPETGIDLTGLEMKLSGLILDKGHAVVKVNRLRFDLGNGFSMKKMKGNLNSDSLLIKLDLDFETGNSHVSLTGSASQSIFDLISGPGGVERANIAIRNTRLSLKDFGLFFDELKDHPQFEALASKPYSLSGELEKTDKQIDISGFSFSQDRNFIISLEGKVENPFPFPNARGKLNLNISDIDTSWLKEILTGFGLESGLPDLTGLTVKSTVSNDFISPDFHIELNSSAGSMDASGSLDFTAGSFSAQSSFDEIDLGKVLEIPELGSFYGSGKISGSGFSHGKFQADFSLWVESLGFKDYTYTQISAEGKLGQEVYKVHVLADDPFLKGDLNASLVSSDSTSGLQISGGLFARLNELHLLKDTLAFETTLEANLLRGRNTLETEIIASDLVLTTPFNAAEVQQLTVRFKTDAAKTIIQASSDFFQLDLQVARPFSEMDELGKDYKEYLATFTDPFQEHSSGEPELPAISALGSINYHPVLGLFLPDTGVYFTNIDLSIDHQAADHKTIYSVGGSGLEYKFLSVGILNTILTDSAGTLELQLLADSNTINSVPVKKLLLSSQFSDWNSLTEFTTYDKQDAIVYGIEIASVADSNSISFNIPSGELIMNRWRWQTDTSKLLALHLKEKMYLPEMHMYADGSSIHISAEQKDETYNYMATLHQVRMGMLFQDGLIPGKPSGSISGSVGYSITGSNEKTVNGNLALSDVIWSDLNFKAIGINGSFKTDSSRAYAIDVAATLDSSKIVAKADKDSGGKSQVHTRFNSIPISIFQPFTKDQVSELSGHISGAINLSSIESNLDVNGHVYFDQAKLRINTLNTAFRIPKDSLSFAGRKVLFDKFRVLDSLDNSLIVDGYADFDPQWQATLDLEVSSSHLQVMNRSEKEDIPLYGNIFVDSRLTLKGPLSNPDISGQIHLSEGTEVFYRQMEDLSLSGTEKIVSFVNHSPEADPSLESPLKASGTAINSSIETIVTIDPTTKINFNLTKRTYDIDVMIEGGGRLNYQMLNNNQVALSGKYEISKGTADVKLIGWPKKSFRISPGGFIRWEGRVEDPELSFEAVNRVTSSYTNPVDGKQRDVVFNVMLKLSQRLSELDVAFTLHTDDKYLMSIINTLSPEEQMKQAITILLFESVNLPGFSTSGNYMSQQVNKLLEAQLNQLAKTTIQGVDISFGIDSYMTPTGSGGEETKTNLSYEVRKSILNNRAQIELSGRFGDLTQQQGSTDLSLNNVSFEYRLDSAATKYLKVYNEHAYEDVFTGEITKTGVGFTYRKRYGFLRDIWRRKKK